MVNVSIGLDDDDQPTLLKNQTVLRDSLSGDILLPPLLESIQKQGFDFGNSLITYWSEADKQFAFAGKYPDIKT